MFLVILLTKGARAATRPGQGGAWTVVLRKPDSILFGTCVLYFSPAAPVVRVVPETGRVEARRAYVVVGIAILMLLAAQWNL